MKANLKEYYVYIVIICFSFFHACRQCKLGIRIRRLYMYHNTFDITIHVNIA